MLALAACNQSQPSAPEGEADKTAEAPAAPVAKMPPPITAQKTYRCADNTIVHIDYFGANEAADIRVGDKTATAVRVSPEAPAAPTEGAAPAEPAAEAKPAGPMKSADGATVLTGSGKQINLKLADKGAQTCKGN
jgi:hypothetical protein